MGRNTEIYMPDREKASQHLYPVLTDGKLYKRTFREFINERWSEFEIPSKSNIPQKSGSQKILGTISRFFSWKNDSKPPDTEEKMRYDPIYEKIIEKVRTDITFITADELFIIIIFLDEELIYSKFPVSAADWQQRERYHEELFNKFGIELLYEVHTSTVCSSYMFQYGNYTHHFPIDEIRTEDGSGGFNISSADFLRFNDYMILMMKHILDSRIYDENYRYDEAAENVINQIFKQNAGNILLLEIIEKEFDWLKAQYEEKKDGPYANTIYYAFLFLEKSIEMKQIINPDKNPRIVVIDSY